MEGKIPTSEKKETIRARVALPGTLEELRPIFDFCATVSKDKYPSSASKIGEPVKVVRDDGKEILKYKTIQSEHFEDLFNMLKDTAFFRDGLYKFLLDKEMSYDHFVDIAEQLYKQSSQNVKKEDLEVFSGILIEYSNINKLVLLPGFIFENKEDENSALQRNSDILMNLINNLNSKAQLAIYS